MPVPDNLQRVAGVDLAVREFVSRVGATRRVRGRRRGYIEAYACPPGALVPIDGRFSFLTSADVHTRAYLSCG